MRSQPRPSDKLGQGDSAWSVARSFIGLVIFTWALRSLVLQPFDIPSGSMLPTLYIGDYLLVAKWPYGYSRFSFPLDFPAFSGRILAREPRRGDVVVFRHTNQNEDLIKRVIGLPGDTVAIANGQLILNGRAVSRTKLAPAQIPVAPNSPCRTVPDAIPRVATRSGQVYCVYTAYLESLPGGPSYTVLDQVQNGPGDDLAPTRVPPGHLFLMGDNRDDSLDSRFSPLEGGVGMLPEDHLVGRALVTFWSTDGSASVLKPWTWFSALRPRRIGNGYVGEAD